MGTRRPWGRRFPAALIKPGRRPMLLFTYGRDELFTGGYRIGRLHRRRNRIRSHRFLVDMHLLRIPQARWSICMARPSAGRLSPPAWRQALTKPYFPRKAFTISSKTIPVGPGYRERGACGVRVETLEPIPDLFCALSSWQLAAFPAQPAARLRYFRKSHSSRCHFVFNLFMNSWFVRRCRNNCPACRSWPTTSCGPGNP